MSGDIADILGGGAEASDPAAAETRGDFTPMPAGWYPFECGKAELRDTKDRKGKYLWLELSVIGERYNGRKVFPKINVMNANAKAVEIGLEQLGDLALACGLKLVHDSQQVVGKQFDARLKIRPAEGNYSADNEVTTYATLGSKSSGEQAAPKAANGAKAPPATAWNKPAEQAATTSATEGKGPAATSTAAPKRPWER